MKRLYTEIVLKHLEHYPQMVFLTGPRQIGKTTIAKELQNHFSRFLYLNWDIIDDRAKILQGDKAILPDLLPDLLQKTHPLIVFDEIHKYKDWKNYLKGFIDQHKGSIHTIVTGSAKLNVFRKGGDSLMGRYFLYRVHGLSVGELLNTTLNADFFRHPQEISEDIWQQLMEFGGYPEPFLNKNKQFQQRWQNLRHEQLFREDIRTLSQVQDLAQMETLAYQLRFQVGQLVSYSNLAKKVRISDSTVRRWMDLMDSFYYCFTIQPWSTNVARSLLKEPKVYLWDWSLVTDKGSRIENFVACHLLKAVHYWTDCGLGKFDLYFIRDKEKREVDFLITKDLCPWLLLEVKKSAREPISPTLLHFAKQLNPQYAFQLSYDAEYVDIDFTTLNTPKILPLKTFLSQLP
ncbi:MAG: ATP-binding protein [Alphaproteobacteria bacterium]